MTIPAKFAAALQHHQAGRPIEAERLYREILQIDPRHADTLYMYGSLFLQVGRSDIAADLIGKAVAAYGPAVSRGPDYAEAHYNLGTALQAQGKLDEAAASYRQALTRKPEIAEAHCNLGTIWQTQGKLGDAAASYRRALAQKPDYAYAHCNLGNTLQAQDELAQAITSFEQALAYDPNLAGVHCNLGNALQAQGKLDEAVVAYERALAQNPDLAEAYCNLGSALRDLGQFGSAEASHQRAIDVDPDNAKFHYGLTEIKRFTATDDPQLVAMEALAREIATLPTEAQSHLRFALGKAYGDLGAHEQSFRHLLAGNALKHSLISYDETTTLALFERIRATFTAELIGGKNTAAAPGGGPIFVIGMPRSGTTLIEQILASHRDVFGAGEVRLFEQSMTALLGNDAYPEVVANLSVDELHRLGTRYRAGLRDLAPTATRITDKLPQNFLYGGLIHLALPDARIVHVRRDPIDTCLSCFAKLFTAGHPYGYDLAELGRYYRHYAALMDHWRHVLPAGVTLDVAYEDVVDDLEGQARRILAHCGLDWDDACLAFDKTKRPVRTASATQVRQPIYKSSVGRWRPDPALLKPLIAEIGEM